MDELQMLIDREAIRGVVVQYCRAVDRRDVSLLKDVYWPDATDDHGFFQGNGHAFAEWNVRATGESMPLTQHYLTNFWCQVDGDQASAESYVLAYHRLVNDDAVAARVLGAGHMDRHGAASQGGHAVVLGGQWFDRFERRDRTWRICHRRAVTHWDLATPGSAVLAEGVFRATPFMAPSPA